MIMWHLLAVLYSGKNGTTKEEERLAESLQMFLALTTRQLKTRWKTRIFPLSVGLLKSLLA